VRSCSKQFLLSDIGEFVLNTQNENKEDCKDISKFFIVEFKYKQLFVEEYSSLPDVAARCS
jgi:hypothetical protein